MIDYFDQALALNDLTGLPLPNAVALVYSEGDTAFESPLAITDITDSPIESLNSGPTGVYPAFKVTSGEKQVIVKSGDVTTPLTSLLGAVLQVVPDPSEAADLQTIVTQAGVFTLAPVMTTPIPDPTLGNDGQVLSIVSGEWTIANPSGGGGTIGGVLDGGTP